MHTDKGELLITHEGSVTMTTDNVVVRNYCQLSDMDLTLDLSQQGYSHLTECLSKH